MLSVHRHQGETSNLRCRHCKPLEHVSKVIHRQIATMKNQLWFFLCFFLLRTGSEEREVLEVGSVPVTKPPSSLQLHASNFLNVKIVLYY